MSDNVIYETEEALKLKEKKQASINRIHALLIGANIALIVLLLALIIYIICK